MSALADGSASEVVEQEKEGNKAARRAVASQIAQPFFRAVFLLLLFVFTCLLACYVLHNETNVCERTHAHTDTHIYTYMHTKCPRMHLTRSPCVLGETVCVGWLGVRVRTPYVEIYAVLPLFGRSSPACVPFFAFEAFPSLATAKCLASCNCGRSLSDSATWCVVLARGHGFVSVHSVPIPWACLVTREREREIPEESHMPRVGVGVETGREARGGEARAAGSQRRNACGSGRGILPPTKLHVFFCLGDCCSVLPADVAATTAVVWLCTYS